MNKATPVTGSSDRRLRGLCAAQRAISDFIEQAHECWCEHSDDTAQVPALVVAPCSASPWKVRVVVCGTHAGDYEYPTYEAARADADEREKKWGVLGCHYRVIPPSGNSRCGDKRQSSTKTATA